ncbi:phospholipid scramblase-related protein [Nocardioides sp. MAHUQ-72]|uniref:phospholipid scramblase-related protein n=1 Tax=unclassified Nocardioides TaxID=2615069 RepID=UPI00361193F5
MSQMPPAGWHPDPFRRSEHRYWDGGRWTEHVASNGQQWIDPAVSVAPPAAMQPTPPVSPPTPAVGQPRARRKAPGKSKATQIQEQVQNLGLANTAGSPDLAIHSEPILVINQKGKLVELRAEYAIYDRNGLQLAAVRGKRMSSRMQVVDMAGRSLLDLRREATILSSKVLVTADDGAKVGRIVPSKNLNQIDRSFKLEDARNKRIGAVYAEDSGRHRDFNVQDTGGTVVARIIKTRAGLAKELFTKGDNYVVEFPGHLAGPLRLLSIATALVIDTSFHQR